MSTPATPTSTMQNMFPPKAKWGVNDMPDLAGRIAIVTGGYTGIGRETVLALLNHNAKVYILGRSQSKADAAIKELTKVTGKTPEFITLDLANLQSVKSAAAEFQSKESRLDYLFNSGGVMFPPIEQVTKEGLDIQIATNALGHFYLTKLLVPTLLATAKISPDGKARVLHTSSMGHTFVKQLDTSLFKDGPSRKKAGTNQMYFQSKYCNVVLASEFARRHGAEGLISVSLHPGNLNTELNRHGSAIERVVSKALLYPAPMGALTGLWGATTSEVAPLSKPGVYLVPWARIGGGSKLTNETKNWGVVWDWCEQQVKAQGLE